MIEVRIQRENANDDVVLITKIMVENGQKVVEGDVLFEFETSKAAVEISSPSNGFIHEFDIKVGEQVSVDTVVAFISETRSPTINSKRVKHEKTHENSVSETIEHISDKAREMLAQGHQLQQVSTWTTSKDLKKQIQTRPYSPEALPALLKEVKDKQHEEKIKKIKIPYKSLQISARKQRELDALSTSSAHVNSTIGIECTFPIPRSENKFFEYSILDFITYEAFLLLGKDFNDLNSTYLGEARVGVFEKVIPGVAFDNGNNLTVLAINDFQNLTELRQRLIEGLIRYDEGKLKASDVVQTTFTISDLSNQSINHVVPLINGFQSFILGVCRNSHGFNIIGTFDHRVTDGKRFSEFLSELSKRIELHSVLPAKFGLSKCCAYCSRTIETEQNFGYRGLIKIDDGMSEKLICRACFEGW